MKFFMKVGVIFFVTCSLCAAATSDLQKGVSVTDDNLTQLAANSHEYDVAFSNQVDLGKDPTVVAFLQIPNSSQLYSLSAHLKLYLSNLDTKADLGIWTVTRSKDEYVESAFLERVKNYQGDLTLDWAESDSINSLGCLGASPLRYGDIDGDGSPELVMYLNDDLLVFSLASHAVIFSAPLKLDDWLDASESQSYLTGRSGSALPQYQSRIAKESTTGWTDVLAGQRGYAKLYLGDFDGDGKPDILVWRKFYTSLLQSDAQKGFKLLSNTYLHYTMANGVYTRKSTSDTTIKGWLTAKNLTWQKGYPDVSECAGQTGKPIPETVDPLLNDPDVLQ